MPVPESIRQGSGLARLWSEAQAHDLADQSHRGAAAFLHARGPEEKTASTRPAPVQGGSLQQPHLADTGKSAQACPHSLEAVPTHLGLGT